jgi:acetyltransferase-like isoleucine patch superfamily enzyme
MSASFRSAAISPWLWRFSNWKSRRLLKKIGAVFPDTLSVSGKPQITLNDLTIPAGSRLDLAPFRGRLVIGKSSLDSFSGSPFPKGPVRLTLVRWGADAEACGKIIIGDQSDLNGTSIISYSSVTIGHGVLFGPNVVIIDCDGHPSDRRLSDTVENLRMAPVVIEDHAWVGFGAMIMKGVRVGSHSVVGANAVLTKDVPPHSVVAGNPAKVIKSYEAETIKKTAEWHS